MDRKTVALDTLGCKLNQYETSGLADQFQRRGFDVVPFQQKADVYVINTCTVTDKTDREGRQLVRRAQRQNPEATIVVTGCYVQYNPQEVAAIPGVHLVVGNADKDRILDLLEEDWDPTDGPLLEVNEFSKDDPFVSFPMTRFPGHTRGFVKIQDGCDLRCSFCAIRIARGPSRSERPERVLDHVRRLVDAGFQELVLTGVHLVNYGRDLVPRTTLATLLEQILAVPGLVRLRLSSMEPLGVTDALLDVLLGDPKICPNLHLALQSGSDSVLRRMRRRYTTRFYRSVLDRIRSANPDFCLGADVLVGFPGETEAEHQESLDFVQDVGLHYLHVFNFSPREGTEAWSLSDRVASDIRARRSAQMRAIHDRAKSDFYTRSLGRAYQAIVLEDVDAQTGRMHCLTGNYLDLWIEAEPSDRGKMLEVRVDAVEGHRALGTIVSRPRSTAVASIQPLPLVTL